MHFRLLGAVEGDVAGKPVDLGWRQERCLLALLLLESGRCLPYERLAELLWEDEPPADPRRAVQVAVSRLRAHLTAAGSADWDVHLVTRGGGYALDIAPERVDVHRFRSLVDEARAEDDPGRRGSSLRAALDLWRGPALADVAGERLRARVAAPLEEQRLAAIEDLMELELSAGRHHEVVAELTGLVAAHSGRERLRGQLMLALYRTGRRVEALAAYQDLRTGLRDGFGLEPGAALQDLHRQMLRDDPALDQDARISGAAVMVPRQLPTDVSGFTGRDEQLRALDRLLPQVSGGGPVPVATITGTAGVGKTSLAVHWAHQVAHRFPDGQFFVNLRGFDPTGPVMVATEVLRGFVTALGVAPPQVPVAEHELVGLYRSLLADRRVLIVLDNARDAGQVRPLLPGASGCLVVVTSRDRLTGLVAVDGGRPVPLDVLTAAEARTLLARRLGADRVAAEPAAAAVVIDRCAGLPLALAIAAATAAVRPALPLATLAEELQSVHSGLDAFGGSDPAADVRAALSGSYRALSGESAKLFRRLGLAPGPDLAAPAVASLAGTTVAAVRPLLAELTAAHLVAEGLRRRYGSHDLLRTYAAELAGADAEPDRAAAEARLFDHYLHSAHAATRTLSPIQDPIPLPPLRSGAVVTVPADIEAALDWFDDEVPGLPAMLERMAARTADVHLIGVALTHRVYLHRRSRWDLLLDVQRTALRAAERLGDRAALADAHRVTGSAYARLGQFDEAEAHVRQTVELAVALGDAARRATAHRVHAWILDRRGRHRDALREDAQALALFQELGDRNGEAAACNGIGWYHLVLGEYHDAARHSRTALAIFEEVGNRNGQAHAWDSLGQSHHGLGEPEVAIDCIRRALDLFREVGDRYHEGVVLDHLGDAHRAAGQADAARQAWRQALAILDELKQPDAGPVRAKLC